MEIYLYRLVQLIDAYTSIRRYLYLRHCNRDVYVRYGIWWWFLLKRVPVAGAESGILGNWLLVWRGFSRHKSIKGLSWAHRKKLKTFSLCHRMCYFPLVLTWSLHSVWCTERWKYGIQQCLLVALSRQVFAFHPYLDTVVASVQAQMKFALLRIPMVFPVPP